MGGTWQRNRYPGLACDVWSHVYSFTFSLNPGWTRSYATQPEILAYIRKTVTDLDLWPYIRLNTGVASARWDDDRCTWIVTTDDGEQIEADAVISGQGMFGELKYPDIEGRDSFEGVAMHTGAWDESVDLAGQRVAVIGSAASAVQFVPEIAPDVEQLHVFQRTPNWVLPKQNDPYTEEQKEAFRKQPELLAESREQLFNLVEKSLTYLEPQFFQAAEDMGRQALDVVEDPELRKQLTPDHPFGAKRPLASNKYLQTFNRSNVELVVDPVERVTPHGVMTADGRGARSTRSCWPPASRPRST